MGDHYLPQVLLKGFASAGSNGMKTFLFLSGADPKLVSIRKVAQERSFHGRRDQTDFESRMSELESQYAPATRAAWVGECGKYVQELSRFVANISARTRNVREGVSGAVEVMLSAAPDALSTDKHLKKIRNQARKTAMRNLREFFFQAEDGIRDYKVTGVQTCALPISWPPARPSVRERNPRSSDRRQ